MSKTIQLGEHYFQLPSAPSSQEDVLFVKESRSEQYWRRDNDFPDTFLKYNLYTIENADATRYDDDGVLLSMNREDTAQVIRLREREMRRRWEGVWIMIDGELTWLSGGNYFQLQWGAVEDYQNPYDGSQYGQYMEFHRDTHYMLEYCRQDIDCGGAQIVKPKKTAITNLLAIDFLNTATKYKQKTLAMMSKSGEDCRKTGFNYFKYALDSLPAIMTPPIRKNNENEVVFGQGTAKATGTRKSVLQQQAKKGFTTKVFVSPTKADGFDGPVIYEGWVDEFTKCEDPYPDAIFKKTSETVKKQRSIHGKMWYSGYVTETNGKAFEEARKVWRNSRLATRGKETGRTMTEIYNYFIPADLSSNGNIDRFGKCDRVRATTYIMAALENKKSDSGAVQAYRRQYPLFEEWAWDEGGGGATKFNNIRLGAQKKIVEEKLSEGHELFATGDLDWEGKPGESRVIFKMMEEKDRLMGREGRFRIYGMEYMDSRKLNQVVLKNMRGENGKLRPDFKGDYVAACDPTKYVQKSMLAGKGSKFAITAFNFPNAKLNTEYNAVVSKVLKVRYLYRDDNPKEMYKDVVKLICWLGCYILVEGNEPWVTTKLIEDGYENFVLVRDQNGAIVPYRAFEHQKLVMTSRSGQKGLIEDYCQAFAEYYAVPTMEGDINYLETLDDEIVLDNLINFKTEDTKIFDAGVCYMLNILAMNCVMAILAKMDFVDEDYASALMTQVVTRMTGVAVKYAPEEIH